MNTTYDFRPQSFARWVKLADEFLRAANLLAESAPWHAAFWYHQAAERYLKAYLVRRGQAFANSVNHLRRLLEMCLALEPLYGRISDLEELDRISEWETAFAYPPQPGEPDPVVPGLVELIAARDICDMLRELALADHSGGGKSDDKLPIHQRDAQGDARSYVSDRFGAVLMTWPPFGESFAVEVARAMLPGQLLIYEGENGGGCTADSAFFDYVSDRNCWQRCFDLSDSLDAEHVNISINRDHWLMFRKVAP